MKVKKIVCLVMVMSMLATMVCGCHTEPDTDESKAKNSKETEEVEDEDEETIKDTKETEEEKEIEDKEDSVVPEYYSIGDVAEGDGFTLELKAAYKYYSESHKTYYVIALVTYTNTKEDTEEFYIKHKMKFFVDNSEAEHLSSMYDIYSTDEFIVNTIPKAQRLAPADSPSIEAGRSITGYIIGEYVWESEIVEIQVDDVIFVANIADIPELSVLAPTPTPEPTPIPTPEPEPTQEIVVDENGQPVEPAAPVE